MTTPTPTTPRFDRENAVAVALASLAVLLFHGQILGGRIIFGSDALPYIFGEKQVLREILAAGRLPLMNPYILCGSPLLENIVAGALYPLNALLLVGSPLWGLHLFIVVHYWLAALAFHALLRHGFGVDSWSASSAAVAYALGGYLWSMVDHLFFAAAPWVPLFLLGLIRLLRAPPGASVRRWFMLGASALALLFTCGNFQQAYDACLFGGLLALFGAVHLFRHGERQRGGIFLLRAGALVLTGALLAAPQLVPTLLAAGRSYRAAGLPLEEAAAWSFPPARLIEYLIPFAFGARQDFGLAVGRFYAGGTAWSDALFIGIPLLAGVFLLRMRGGRCLSLWLVALGVVALLLALGRFTPFHRLAFDWLPGFATFRHPEKYLFWVHVGACAAGGLGLCRLGAGEPAAARRCLVLCLGFGVATALALLSSLGFLLLAPERFATLLRQSGSAWPPARLVLWQFGQGLGSGLALAALALSVRRATANGTPGLVPRVAFGLTALHLLALGWAVPWTIPASWLRQVTPAVELLPAAQSGLYRTYTDAAVRAPAGGAALFERDPRAALLLGSYARMTHNAPALFGVRTINGFSALMDPAYVEFTSFERHHPQAIMNLLAVRYLIVAHGVGPENLPPGNVLLAENARDGYSVLENRGALPRIHLATRHVLAAPAEAVRTAFEFGGRGVLRPRAATGPMSAGMPEYPPVVLEQLPSAFVPGAMNAAPGEPQVLVDQPGKVVVEAAGPAWLVLRDWHLPGWRARIDTHGEATVCTADGGLMAVFVPVGEHRIEFRYRQPGWRLGVAGMLAGFAALLALFRGRPAPAEVARAADRI